jgi:ATP-dependent RNA helicase DDX54/DBP10
MDHVINLDFPPNPRVFVHRVGRTARGGRKGTAWSLLDKDDLPYFADLAQHLATTSVEPELVRLPRGPIETAFESMQALSSTATDLLDLRAVMRKGDSMYKRSRSKASSQGYRTARLYADESLPIFQLANAAPSTDQDASRQSMIDVISAFRPAATSIAVKPRRIGKVKRAASPKPAEDTSPAPDPHAPRIETAAAPAAAVGPAAKVRTTKICAHHQDFKDASFYLQHAQKDDGNKMWACLQAS